MITHSRLHELVTYDDKLGHFFWNLNRPNGARKGDIAGCLDKRGYWRISLDGVYYKAHRLVYLYFDKPIPRLIDHINGLANDNRVENLREASSSENQMNRYCTVKNKLGIKNVHLNKCGKYVVQIGYNSKQHFLGSFDDLELAELVASEARDKYHRTYNRYATPPRC